MKFSNGAWLLRDGVNALYPVHVRDASADATSLTAYAPTARVAGREDTLDLALVTVRCDAPAPDVVAVTVTHHSGGRARSPQFELAGAPTSVVVDQEAGTLTSGALTVRIDRGERFRLDFLAGDRVLTSSGQKAMAVVTTADGGHYVRDQLTLGVGETVYGLGERFGPLVKNGQVVDVWNADGGTSSEQAYKNVPFYLTTGGYGVFVDHPGQVSFEVASEVVSRVGFSVAGQRLRYLVIYGPTPAEILRKYTALTGRPALPPVWSFGLWLSTSFTTDYDERTVTGFIDAMAERDLPLSVFHFDCFWMREFHWCDFEWDAACFPDPAGMLKRIKERGLRVSVWMNPYIAQRSAMFTEGATQGYLLRRPNGDVWQWDRWQAGMGLVDFTNPAACEWFAAKLRALLDLGVDCFKSDFGERIPTDVVYHDGSDPELMHNYYTLLYNRLVFDVIREHRGEGQAVLFARSATAGGQQYPVHWGGDCSATFESMAESLRGGLSLAMCGFGFWSHDIGGFEGLPDAAVFKRWIPFGLLSSHSRLHGNQSYRVPWQFDEEAVDVLRIFTKLKCSLMPYLFQQGVLAHTEGVPVMRPMVFDFPDDPAVAYLERQYMLGDALLVAPVFCEDGATTTYLPAGRWTSYLTGEVFDGPAWVRQRHGFDSVGLFVRPGSVVPVGSVTDRPDYDYTDGVTLRAYEPADGARTTVTIPDLRGAPAATFDLTRTGDQITVTRTGGAATPWRVLLAGRDAAGRVEGGTAAASPLGTMIEVEGDTRACVVTLASKGGAAADW
ncbi:MAG: alpha-xylosidase [Micromonosporaceae bacterium]|nr:alpha-xylosidase [Micromonosporaceae bacterium]